MEVPVTAAEPPSAGVANTLSSSWLRWWGIPVYSSLTAMLFDLDDAQADDASIVGGVGSRPWVFGLVTVTIVIQCGLFIRASVLQLKSPDTDEANTETFMGRLRQFPRLNKVYWCLAIVSCGSAILNMLYLSVIFFHNVACNSDPQMPFVNDTLPNATGNGTKTGTAVDCQFVMATALVDANRGLVWSSRLVWMMANGFEVGIFLKYKPKQDINKRWQSYATLVANVLCLAALSSLAGEYKPQVLAAFVVFLWLSLPWQQPTRRVNKACRDRLVDCRRFDDLFSSGSRSRPRSRPSVVLPVPRNH
jgi:hypothetical protein